MDEESTDQNRRLRFFLALDVASGLQRCAALGDKLHPHQWLYLHPLDSITTLRLIGAVPARHVRKRLPLLGPNRPQPSDAGARPLRRRRTSGVALKPVVPTDAVAGPRSGAAC